MLFLLEYDICARSSLQFNGDRIKVVTPGYSTHARYPKNKRCIMQLSSVSDTIFKVDFTKLHLQSPDVTTKECSDYLLIRDGDDVSAKILAKYCGRDIPKATIFTTANKIYVEFKSDNQIEERGFKIYVSAIKKPTTEVTFSPGKKL